MAQLSELAEFNRERLAESIRESAGGKQPPPGSTAAAQHAEPSDISTVTVFVAERRKARFTNSPSNLELKEYISQYCDYLQSLIADSVGIDKCAFGHEVR